MHLKQIEMIGFKSFADRTKIDFDLGVTAIVGPNGSGKSNVTESLRWALGEQSAKSLRGAKMPDIIFAGTEKRQALNYAEVIVTFDNQDHYLSGDDQVVVTRRLYRNGDSEFLINGKKVRLKDIHELFTDTGLGRDSFSIISQGRIESIFNSKPEERRSIIEEAAGVLKYKGRKKETHSKLLSTQDNIDRLVDIIYELDNQLAPLEKQRDTALAFQKLDQEQTQLDLAVLIAQINAKDAHYQADRARYQELTLALQEQEGLRSQYQTHYQALRKQLKALEQEQDELTHAQLDTTRLTSETQKRLEVLEAQEDMSDQAQKERQERQEKFQAQVSELTSQQEKVQTRASGLDETIDRINETIKSLQAELTSLSQSPEVQEEALRTQFMTLLDEEAKRSNQITRDQAMIDQINREAATQDDSMKETRKRYDLLAQQIAERKRQLGDASSNLEGLLTSYEAQKAELVEVEKGYQTVQDEQFKLLDSLTQKKAKLTSLENIQASHANLYQGVKMVLNHQTELPGIIGNVGELVVIQPDYLTAIDIALGANSQHVIVKDEAAARAAINFLKKHRYGRVTFLPLTTIKPRQVAGHILDKVQYMKGFIDIASNLVSYPDELATVFANLLGATIIVDTAEHATLIAKSVQFSVRIVTLDGTLINPGGSFTGGAGKQRQTTFTQSEMQQIKSEIQTVSAALTETEKQVAELQARRTAYLDELDRIKAAGEEARLFSKEREVNLANDEAQLAELQAILAASSQVDATEEVTQLTQQIAEAQVRIEAIAQEKGQIDQALAKLKASATDTQLERESLQEAIQDEREALVELKSEQKHLNQEAERLTASLANLRQEMAELAQASELVADSAESVQAEKQRLAEQLAMVQNKALALGQGLDEIKHKRSELEVAIAEKQGQQEAVSQQIQAQSDKKIRLELALEQAKQYLLTRQTQLSERHSMTFEQAKQVAQEIDDLAQAEQALKQVEQAIRQLGPVNLEAIAQFEEVSQRHAFLSQQKDDLVAAKDLLMQSINAMDDEVRVRFKQTFEAVREAFKVTFRQMFGGGEANLLLTSDDLLEAGIEIAVQPPGKKLASLNLMSGGEKSLTALALLFAILRVRTVPFVVLDEVEAALDEANVKRFGDYMTRFDDASQFIVVTHRKGTMAAANAMYGVTMQEGGISKVVSVKLKEAVNLIGEGT